MRFLVASLKRARFDGALAVFLAAGCGADPPGGPAPNASAAPPAGATPVVHPAHPSEVKDLYGYALAVAEGLRTQWPQLDEAFFLVADAQRRFGFDDRAIAAYRQGLDLNPRRPDILAEIGFLLSQKSRFDEAIETYRAAIAVDSRFAGGRTRLGLIYAHQGKTEDAIRAYDEEIQNQSSSIETWYSLGQAQLLAERAAKAEVAFLECLRREPDHLNALYGLHQACRALGKTEESNTALARFQEQRRKEIQAEAAAPKEKSSRERELADAAAICLQAGRLRLRLGDRAAGLRDIEAATTLEPRNAEAQLLLLDQLRGAGQAQEARARGEKALEAAPDSGELLYLVAGLRAEAKDFAASARALARLVELEPKHAAARRELARAILAGRLHGAESPARALEQARKAVELERSAAQLDVLAWALLQSRQTDAAEAALEEALKLEPQNETIRRRLEGFRRQKENPRQ